MAFQLWSWIFIFQTLLIRFAYAHVSHDYEALAGRALESVVFMRSLTTAQKARNTFIALAIAAGVVLVAGVIGLFLLYRRQKAKIPETESGVAVEKPHWWMVDAKNEKMDWWRLSNRISQSPTSDSGRFRIERLKDALKIQRKGAKQQPLLPTHSNSVSSGSTHSPDLPMQTNQNIQPRYPHNLERGYQAPIYPIQSPPQINVIPAPSLKRLPTVPPRAIVTQGQRTARNGGPRSPANRRWMSRNSFRHPFLPLKDSDGSLNISAPMPAAIDPSNPKLGYAITIKHPRPAPTPPGGLRETGPPALPPKVGMRKAAAALLLEEPFGGRKFGLPGSPRPSALLASPRSARPATPAF